MHELGPEDLQPALQLFYVVVELTFDVSSLGELVADVDIHACVPRKQVCSNKTTRLATVVILHLPNIEAAAARTVALHNRAGARDNSCERKIVVSEASAAAGELRRKGSRGD